MFDFSFWELTIVLMVALVVVGPDKLPILAGKIGRWVGKIKQMVTSVRSDIEQELKSAELKEMLEQQQSEISQLRNILKDAEHSTQNEIRNISAEQSDMSKAVDAAVAQSPSNPISQSTHTNDPTVSEPIKTEEKS